MKKLPKQKCKKAAVVLLTQMVLGSIEGGSVFSDSEFDEDTTNYVIEEMRRICLRLKKEKGVLGIGGVSDEDILNHFYKTP